MATALTTARDEETDAVPAKARRCLATGEVRPKSELIRFVVAPDQSIVPDLAQNLPGRGLWVTATHEAIDLAARKNLFSRAAKANVTVDPDLATVVAARIRRRCLDFVGLACGAGVAVLGLPQVQSAMKARFLKLLIIAEDAAANGTEKIGPVSCAAARGFTREELGASLGYAQIVYVGFKKHGITQKLHDEIARLEKVTNKRHLYDQTDSGMQ